MTPEQTSAYVVAINELRAFTYNLPAGEFYQQVRQIIYGKITELRQELAGEAPRIQLVVDVDLDEGQLAYVEGSRVKAIQPIAYEGSCEIGGDV